MHLQVCRDKCLACTYVQLVFLVRGFMMQYPRNFLLISTLQKVPRVKVFYVLCFSKMP